VSLRTPLAAARTPRVEPLPQLLYEPLVRAALLEDLGLGGDRTSEATVPRGTRARGALVARAAGVLAGLDVGLLAFRLLDPALEVECSKGDGERLALAEVLATLAGDARALLGAERTALNLLAHLSGIASATAAAVAAAGGACAIAETRKTTPGLRALEKYAVRAGGGTNHRLRLDDAILIKDNHVALAGGVGAALERARAAAGHLVKVEIEVDTLAQLDEVLAHRELADAVLLDNFSLDDVREAVRRIAGRLLVEVSGGVSLERIAETAAAGVDVISVGALTHSVAALDIGLDIAEDER
jgi:nicotinate-nucleotide pyrophosphorylase (carboxylating)